MSLERRKNFIINLSYYLLIAAIIYIVIKYLLGLLTPFIIGFLVAFGLQSSIKFLAKKLRLAKKFVAVILVLLFYIVIGSLVFWLGVAVFAWLRDVVERLPGIYAMEIEPLLARIFISLETFMARYDLTLVQLLAELRVSMSQSIANIVSEISSMAIAAITSTVSLLPRMLIGIVLSIISSVFFAMDYELITGFLINLLPSTQRGLVGDLRKFVSGIGIKYVKAYALLMFITFTELAIGLSILRVEGALSIAALTAVVDMLPVLGTGLVIIPWAFFHLLSGEVSLGIGLLIMYAIISVIRNALEPKLVGQQIGLHPIVILLCMYVGVSLFGIIGLIALPFTILVIKHLYEQGHTL